MIVFVNKGYSVTSEDVAFAWLELISDGYSAERTALENLRKEACETGEIVKLNQENH